MLMLHIPCFFFNAELNIPFQATPFLIFFSFISTILIFLKPSIYFYSFFLYIRKNVTMHFLNDYKKSVTT